MSGGMYSALLISASGDMQELTVYSVDAVAAVVGDRWVDCLTSSDGMLDFWFGSATSARGGPNRRATGLLVTTSGFSARTVPLLYGSVLVCSRSSEGRLLGLTGEHRERLRPPGWLSRWWLRRRFAHPIDRRAGLGLDPSDRDSRSG